MKKPGVPDSVHILGRDFVVDLVADMVSTEGKCGDCNAGEHRIRMDPGQSPIDLRDTLLHEIIHAIDFYHGTGMSERQVLQVATGLIAVFEHNPSVVKFIVGE